MRKNVLAAGVILLVALAVIVGIYALQDDTANVEAGQVTATLTIAYGNARDNATVTYDNLTVPGENATVYGLTMAAAQTGDFNVDSTYYGQYDSRLVDGVDGVANGQNDSYWQYTVNGNAGNVGADRHPIEDGDHVTWTFTESQFGG
ncbi:MAG: DUF4430 domain-containing protein [Thermoplasmatota archaeon]